MNDNELISRLESYIDAHIEEDLSLDKISEKLNYSKFYISRTFAEKTG